MPRTLQNAMMAVLLIAALGSRCVIACVGPAELQKSAADAHACCKKNAGPAKTQLPKSDCQSQAFEIAKVTTHVAPPLADIPFVSVDVPVIETADGPQLEPAIYSPPDLVILHQVFLI